MSSEDVWSTVTVEHGVPFSPVTSFLSPYVQELLTQHTLSTTRDDRVLDQDGLIDFTHICQHIPDLFSVCSDADVLSNYFTSSVIAFAPMLHSVEDRLSAMDKNAFLASYAHLLHWTGPAAKILLEVWSGMLGKPDSDSVDQLATLLTTMAVLERSLGNVYLIQGKPPCPSMLKDLLITGQLQDVLGENVIKVLRLIIGPPTSLNLRNVAWHGFPFPGEIPTRCIWFVILLVPSIGSVLEKEHVQRIQYRQPIRFPKGKSISDESVFTCGQDWEQVVNNTDFVPWNVQHFWMKVKQHYIDKRYSVCCALLLYYLEQGLRRVFATVNHCEHRILTAQATVLYTTLDEILDQYLPDGTENRLASVIGNDLLEILLDQLSYQNGARIRDRLSHGEACWDTFPRQLADNMATVTVALSAMLTCKGHPRSSKTVLRLQKDISSYNVQFHKICLLKIEILDFFQLCAGVDGNVHVMPDMSARHEGQALSASADSVKLETDIQALTDALVHSWSHVHITPCFSYMKFGELYELMKDVLSVRINTLYRPPVLDGSGIDREGEIVSCLRHIIEECNNVVVNIRHFICLRELQLQQKELRSRQRDNYKKFLTSFPGLLMGAGLCCFTCCWQLYNLHLLTNLTEHQNKLTVKLFKSILQFSENLRTFSHSEKNKWKEAQDLTAQFIKHLQANLPTLTAAASTNLHNQA